MSFGFFFSKTASRTIILDSNCKLKAVLICLLWLKFAVPDFMYIYAAQVTRQQDFP